MRYRYVSILLLVIVGFELLATALLVHPALLAGMLSVALGSWGSAWIWATALRIEDRDQWLRDMKGQKAKETQDRTFKARDNLTPWERGELDASRCPDCGKADTLMNGPSGGNCVNLQCSSCHVKFNAAFGFTGFLWAERLTDRMVS